MIPFIPPTEGLGLSEEEARRLPLGLRYSNNPFNIKYVPGAERNQTRWPGLIGPSEARDQGDPQMKFGTLEDGGVAGANLLLRKYDSGMRTPQDLIAGPKGWTPGYGGAAVNVAQKAGVGVSQDANLRDPVGLSRFMGGLATQEHGAAGARHLGPDFSDRVAERVTGHQVTTGALPKLEPLDLQTGSNAHRWGQPVARDHYQWDDVLPPEAGGGPMMRPPSMMGATAAQPQPTPSMQPRQGQAQPSFMDDLKARLLNPLTLAGLAGLESSARGGSAFEGINRGMQTGAAFEAQRQSEAQKAAVERLFSDPSKFGELPPALLEIARVTKDPSPLIQHIVKSQTAGHTDDIKEYQFAKTQGFQGSLQEWMQTKRGTGEEFGKNPIYGTRDGKTVVLQTTGRGGLKEAMLPQGVEIPSGIDKVDAGTHYVLMSKRDGNVVGQIPKNTAEVERQKVVGEERGKAQVNLPAVESQSQQILKYIDDVAGDPYLNNMTGFVGGRLPNISEKSKAVQAKIDQLNSNAFLIAFERLKGAGAITEAEGRAATTALTRLREQMQSGADYRQALQSYRDEVQRITELAKTRAGGGAAPAQQQKRFKFNPQTGELE